MSAEIVVTQTSKSAFTKLFATGLLGWLIGGLLLFGAAWPIIKPEVVPIAVVWALSYWWVAFVFGAVLLVIRGLLSRVAFGSALLAYLLPAGLLWGITVVCQLIYPNQGFGEDLRAYLSLVVLFYIIGLGWAMSSKDVSGNSTLLRAVLPAIMGGMIIHGLVAVPVFNSNAFKYHKAFALSVSKRALQAGGLTADAILEIRKPGSYVFTSPRSIDSGYEDMDEMDSVFENGEITWGSAGAPKEGSTGAYPFQIRWLKSVPATETALAHPGEADNFVTVEVWSPAVNPAELLISVYAELPLAKD